MKQLLFVLAVCLTLVCFTSTVDAGGCSNNSGFVGNGVTYYGGGGSPAYWGNTSFYGSRGVNVGVGGFGRTFNSPFYNYYPRGGSFYRGSVGFGSGFPGAGFGYGPSRYGGFGGFGGGFGGRGISIGIGF